MLFRAAQGMALLSGRDFVLPDDVQSVAPFVLSHRIELERGFERNLKKAQNLVRDVVDKVPVPV